MGIYGDLLKLNQPAQADAPAVSSRAQQVATKLEEQLSTVQPETNSTGIEAIQSDHQGDNPDTLIPRHHGIKQSRHHDTVIPLIRAAVKQFGKEAATHRFTPDEKRKVAEVVFAYRNQNIRTSENEIARIGVNYLVEDYKLRGDKSILDQVLKALNE